MDKYCDIEKTFKTNIDSWLCNMYFSIRRKDTLANPYSVQLILDEETQSRYAKSMGDQSNKPPANSIPSERPKKLNKSETGYCNFL